MFSYLHELSKCTLCEHRCGVNRLEGHKGVCGITIPEVASAQLHPAPPQSYTIFLAGCNYRCLNCQNWTISGYPDNGLRIRGFVEPRELAREAVEHLHSPSGRLMRADRIFFSGGEATIHIPFIEEVAREARLLDPDIRINFDTNGFLTEESLRRVLRFATSITYDIKAFHDDTHRALTGCTVEPVLRNAAIIGREHPDQLWEYRILVVPGINEEDIPPMMKFISEIDPGLPVAFLAFRPNHVLESYPGAGRSLLNHCVEIARSFGIRNAHWAGMADIYGQTIKSEDSMPKQFEHKGAALAATYAIRAGCKTVPRDCRSCRQDGASPCPIKGYTPSRST